MQRNFYSRLASAAFLLISLMQATPGNAQLAYTLVDKPVEVATDPVDEKPAAKPTYKLIHGVIQGEQGVLPGATVWLQGSKTIAVTNAEGEFELRVPSDAKVVKLACGYGGLQEEVVTLAPVQAMGSLYLMHVKAPVKH
ncbi:carboxypeptidase-like regulatory domain-containing protein [Hymenobacter sp. 5317J-9]|uniref:carboxypeptidase-like regulatory domain-containing protein n=1 Tax=Hymenobacter sp. 5317J-9 TaxID=2932250 RepID=UPI001FD66980|nr:carboxypeptidase-like regulatory domain-containing protein [Hymenobacter sp. 5317J-9]UOQ97400.1 carboxypeptidase-like regulatory domain-containing protein [Hymenobacter sp. 5317J-9]